jgi:hypothetical protein
VQAVAQALSKPVRFRQWLVDQAKGGQYRTNNECECPLAAFLSAEFPTATDMAVCAAEVIWMVQGAERRTPTPDWALVFVQAIDGMYGAWRYQFTITAAAAREALDLCEKGTTDVAAMV